MRSLLQRYPCIHSQCKYKGVNTQSQLFACVRVTPFLSIACADHNSMQDAICCMHLCKCQVCHNYMFGCYKVVMHVFSTCPPIWPAMMITLVVPTCPQCSTPYLKCQFTRWYSPFYLNKMYKSYCSFSDRPDDTSSSSIIIINFN